jgi:hypothetical protein
MAHTHPIVESDLNTDPAGGEGGTGGMVVKEHLEVNAVEEIETDPAGGEGGTGSKQ